MKGLWLWHRAQYDHDATVGNKKLIESIKGHESRLIPSWTVLPDITDREYAPNIFFDNMKKNGIRVLRAYPEQDRYFLCDVTMGEQLAFDFQLIWDSSTASITPSTMPTVW